MKSNKVPQKNSINNNPIMSTNLTDSQHESNSADAQTSDLPDNGENSDADSYNRKEESKRKNEILRSRFERDYDNQVELIADQATSLIANGSFLNCGLYQFVSFVFISVAWTVGNGWYAYFSIFQAFTPKFTCDLDAMNANSSMNLTLIPDDSCFVRALETNQTFKCTKWLYDESQMVNTMITEYDLVCERNYVFEMAFSMEQVGYIVGTLVFSFIADKVGRKPVFVSVTTAMSLFGLAQHFITNLTAFFVFGFIINSLACGLEAACVTLVLEMFSTSKRTIFGIGIEVVWVIVLASMAPLAYSIKKWREIRLVIFVILGVLALLSYWLVEESIRWLISIDKISKANRIVDRVSKFNRLAKKPGINYEKNKEDLKYLFDELSFYNHSQKSKKSEGEKNGRELYFKKIDLTSSCESNSAASIETSSVENKSTEPFTLSNAVSNKRANNKISDIIKYPKFRMYVFIMALNWFATALVYDGLTYMNNYIGESIFFNWILMNMIELPAQFVCYLVVSRYGRRLTVSATLIMAGVTLLLTLLELIPAVQQLTWLKLTLFVVAKFIITQSYSGVILHAPELFPTNLRSFGYGISLFSGKVTAVISPIISIYLGKVMPNLPPLIYGVISILCGFISLYVPETLNRPLPNSIEDVLKWPRVLTGDEKLRVQDLNNAEMNKIKNLFRRSVKKDESSEVGKVNLDEKSKSKLTVVNSVSCENELAIKLAQLETSVFSMNALKCKINKKSDTTLSLSSATSSSSTEESECSTKKEPFTLLSGSSTPLQSFSILNAESNSKLDSLATKSRHSQNSETIFL